MKLKDLLKGKMPEKRVIKLSNNSTEAYWNHKDIEWNRNREVFANIEIEEASIENLTAFVMQNNPVMKMYLASDEVRDMFNSLAEKFVILKRGE